MSTTDKESIAAGTDNRPSMLEESDFDSWKIRIQRYIRGKPNGKLIWNSIKNGPTPHPTTTDTTGEGEQQTQVIRKKRDDEFTEAENIKELADIQAINILSQGLPRHIFNTLNQTETAQEIWENVELLMQGSGLTEQQQKEILFDQYERFRANGNESIHDYFVRFHKLINDMKITKIQILAHQRNTKFLNNLPSYWSKYVTIVKNSQDISNVSYVNLYTHLKSYEQHAMKTLSKMNQSSGNTDPLAYMAQATKTSSHTSSQQYSPSVPPQSPQSTNDAMLATMNQIVNLLSGFQKQFPPTNNQLRTSTNPMTQATIQAGQITTENVQRRAPGNKGKQIATGSQGKLVTCYNCRGQGHIARECKEKKREKDSQWFKDKALLMEAKEKGAILDAEAEAFLADVECTSPYVEPLAITTTTAFEVSHEDAYDSDVDEAPHAAAAFMANLTGTSTGEGTSNDTDFHSEVHTHNNHFFENMNHQVTQAMHQEEQLDSDVDSDIDDYDNIIPYHQYQSNTEVENVPTKVSPVLSDQISMITILDDMRLKLEGYMNTNKEQSLANDSLKAELERYKTQVQNLEQSKVESNKSLKTESEKLKIDNKAHEDRLTQTALGHSNPKYLITAQLSRLALYRGDIVINPLHTPHRVHDNEDTLVHAEVSRTKMSEKMKDLECPIISSPINYAKLNNLYDTFVPQKELTREQAYWLPANEVASNQSKPAQQFVHTRPAKSQVNSHLKTLKSCFPEFDEVIKFRTKPTCLTDGEWRFEHTKRCFVEQIIPFYEKLKTHVKGIEDNLFKEVSEYMKFFDKLDKEYDQCVIDKKCLEIENKNLLIQNECLLAESISKYICSVVLTPDNVVSISVEPCSNCDKEQTRNLELEAEFSKVKQLLVDKERRCSHIETEYLNLELKFQKYKECFENPQVCNNLNSPELNIFFKINKLKEQLQGKDNTIGKLKAHINNMKDVSTGPSLSTLEIENTKLKEGITAVKIKNDSLRDENVSIKERFQELYKSKAGSNSSVSSGATILLKPKAVASGLYAMTPKYVPPQKRINRETNSSLPRKETVTIVDLSNVPVNLPTRIKYVPDASKSKSKSDKKIHKNLPDRNKKVKRVAKPPRNLNKNRVDYSLNDKCTGFISKSVSVCKTCNECLVFGNHDECVVKSMNAKKTKVINNANVKQVWKATGKVFASVGSRWKPTRRKFTFGDTCPLTRINKTKVVSIANSRSVRTSEPTNNVTVTPRFSEKTLTSYKRKDRNIKDTSTGSPSNIETMAA
ncbi:trichome birefringence-like protein 2 [Tanacetum coccineum]